MTRHREIRSQDIWLDDDGIIRARLKPGIDLQLDDAKEVVAVMASLGGGVPRPVLVDVGATRSMSRDARKYFAGAETAKVESAVALLIKSPLARAIGNFFMGVNKTLFPTRLFTSEEEALAWLRDFLT
jgi:hypothetical protein